MTELERLRARIAELVAEPTLDFYQNEELGRCLERLRELETKYVMEVGLRRDDVSTETCEGFRHAP